MIVLFLKDGFGNQLFEYAFVRKLSLLCKDRIVINRIYFKRKKDRTCQLEKLVLNDNVTFSTGFVSFLLLLLLEFRIFLSLGFRFYRIHTDREFFNKSFCGATNIFSRCQRFGVYLSTDPFAFFDNIRPSSRKIKLVFGNFENASFFKDCFNELRDELKLKTPVDISTHLDTSACNVAVHIRRGDYMSPQWKSLNVCTKSYYVQAMRTIRKMFPDAVFNIFSNTSEDLEWIKENYQLEDEGCVKYMNTGLDDVSDFFIMSACRHFIIANSTYSWWAAYLSRSKGKVVIAPDIWSIGSPQSEGLYLPEFIRLKIQN